MNGWMDEMIDWSFLELYIILALMRFTSRDHDTFSLYVCCYISALGGGACQSYISVTLISKLNPSVFLQNECQHSLLCQSQYTPLLESYSWKGVQLDSYTGKDSNSSEPQFMCSSIHVLFNSCGISIHIREWHGSGQEALVGHVVQEWPW